MNFIKRLAISALMLLIPLTAYSEVDPVPVFCLAGWIPACSGYTWISDDNITYQLYGSFIEVRCDIYNIYNIYNIYGDFIEGGGNTYNKYGTFIEGGGNTYNIYGTFVESDSNVYNIYGSFMDVGSTRYNFY